MDNMKRRHEVLEQLVRARTRMLTIVAELRVIDMSLCEIQQEANRIGIDDVGTVSWIMTVRKRIDDLERQISIDQAPKPKEPSADYGLGFADGAQIIRNSVLYALVESQNLSAGDLISKVLIALSADLRDDQRRRKIT